MKLLKTILSTISNVLSVIVIKNQWLADISIILGRAFDINFINKNTLGRALETNFVKRII